MNPKSLLQKYKQREEKKDWKPRNPADKLNQFLFNSIERKPIFSKKIDEYLKKQTFSILKEEFREFGDFKMYKGKYIFQPNEKYNEIYNALSEEDREVSKTLGKDIFNGFLFDKLIERIGVSKNG